jgi:TPR repeat protein
MRALAGPAVLLGFWVASTSAGADEFADKCAKGVRNTCVVAVQALVVQEEWDKAEALALAGCKVGDCATYSIAEPLRQIGQGPRAAALLQKGCEAADELACGELASWYQVGFVVPRDAPRALALYDRACAGSSLFGSAYCSELANMLRYDDAIPRDEARAAKAMSRWATRRAAAFENSDKGSTADAKTAETWERECRAGKNDLCFLAVVNLVAREQWDRATIAAALEFVGKPERAAGLRYLADRLDHAGRTKEGRALLAKYCANGSAPSCGTYAYWLALGIGGPKDLPEAERIAHLVCDKGQSCGALSSVLEMTGRAKEGRELKLKERVDSARKHDPEMIEARRKLKTPAPTPAPAAPAPAPAAPAPAPATPAPASAPPPVAAARETSGPAKRVEHQPENAPQEGTPYTGPQPICGEFVWHGPKQFLNKCDSRPGDYGKGCDGQSWRNAFTGAYINIDYRFATHQGIVTGAWIRVDNGRNNPVRVCLGATTLGRQGVSGTAGTLDRPWVVDAEPRSESNQDAVVNVKWSHKNSTADVQVRLDFLQIYEQQPGRGWVQLR